MKMSQVIALVRTDLLLHLTNRRALIISILVPIIIAAFFGYLFGNSDNAADRGKLQVALVDHDASDASREIISQLGKEAMLATHVLEEDEARAQVRSGKAAVAVVFPAQFASAAEHAFFRQGSKPQVEILFDPSQAMPHLVVEGLLAQHGMQVLTRDAFSGVQARVNLEQALASVDRSSDLPPAQKEALHEFLASAQKLNASSTDPADAERQNPLAAGLSVPYEVSAEPVTSGSNTAYNSYAHSFAGMAVQFILFAGIDAGVVLLLTMERGLWQRLRAAPLGKSQLLLAKTLATTLISLATLVLIYCAAILIFKVRIEGSMVGFFAVAISFCLLNASFGLLLASIGRTASTTRGLATMVTILLVMLGGAWVPAFVFPKWLQTVSLFVPTRWAVDGFDAMTWRGLGLDSAIGPVGVMLGTAVVCLLIAIWRMPWGSSRQTA